MKISKAQEKVFNALVAIPGVEIKDVDESYSSVVIRFERIDPRPSRNGLVNDGFSGHIFVGPRGKVRGHYYQHELFGQSVDIKETRQFWQATHPSYTGRYSFSDKPQRPGWYDAGHFQRRHEFYA